MGVVGPYRPPADASFASFPSLALSGDHNRIENPADISVQKRLYTPRKTRVSSEISKCHEFVPLTCRSTSYPGCGINRRTAVAREELENSQVHGLAWEETNNGLGTGGGSRREGTCPLYPTRSESAVKTQWLTIDGDIILAVLFLPIRSPRLKEHAHQPRLLKCGTRRSFRPTLAHPRSCVQRGIACCSQPLARGACLQAQTPVGSLLPDAALVLVVTSAEVLQKGTALA